MSCAMVGRRRRATQLRKLSERAEHMTEHTSALSICCCQWGLMTTPLEGVADGCMDGGDGYPGMLCESEGWCWCI